MNHIILSISIAVLTITTSCGNHNSADSSIITDGFLEGKWVLDSVNVKGFDTREELFFAGGKMYRCSYCRDGYFIDSATYRQSKIDSYSNRTYELTKIDTNKLLIKSRVEYYYKKVREDNVQEEISRYRIGDKLRKNYIGYWSPINTPTSPIEIMNYSPVCKSVSFEILNNGSADFYINQVKDSIVHHSFRVRGDAPQFSNGCLVGDYGITWNRSKTELGMVFSRFPVDTIWFEKKSR